MAPKATETGIVKKEPVSAVAAATPQQEMSLAIAEDLISGQSGFEGISSEDIAIPFVRILQALSPQVKKGPDKIEGAEEGDLYNTVTGEVYKKGITVVSCAFQKAYVEWTPREEGGGFVKQHPTAQILEQTKKGGTTGKKDVLPNGNIVETTAYHFCILVKEDGTTERIVLAFSSTQLKKSRRWIGQMQAIKINVGGKIVTPPMFSYTYRILTAIEQKDQNSWYGYTISEPKQIDSRALYEEAKDFNKAVTSGTVKAAEPIQDITEEGNDLTDAENTL